MPYKGVRGGRRPYLAHVNFRSRWEYNCAVIYEHLRLQGRIVAWAFEPRTFIFHGVTRGCVQYTPDFCLTYPDGSVEYIEVKGRETSRDRTKWKRMAKFYPDVKFSVIGEANYRRLAANYGGLEHWEH